MHALLLAIASLSALLLPVDVQDATEQPEQTTFPDPSVWADPIMLSDEQLDIYRSQAVPMRLPTVAGTDIDDLTEAQRDGVPPLPEDAVGIGPGSPLLITIPQEGTFICTANYVFQSGGRHFLGAAGHCFLPEDREANHGPGADYNAGGVVTEVCLDFCVFGGQLTGLLDG